MKIAIRRLQRVGQHPLKDRVKVVPSDRRSNAIGHGGAAGHGLSGHGVSRPSVSAQSASRPRPAKHSEHLLHRLAGGDRAAVDAALATFGALVWSIARRHHNSREDAEDAVQEVFLDLWRTAGRFDPAAGSEATFVATVAHRRCIDRHRRAQARPRFEDAKATFDRAGTENCEVVEQSEEGELLRAQLEELRPAQRRVIQLSFLDGLSHSQIAELLDMPLGTVKTHARRGLQRLAALLQGTSLAASMS